MPIPTFVPILMDMVEVPFPGAGIVLGLKVTPVIVELNVIDELNPFVAAVVIVLVPVDPRAIWSLEGFAFIVKFAVPPPPAKALISAGPFGLPQPVTRSNSGVA